MDGFSRMGPRGKPLVRHLSQRGVPVRPEMFARMNDRATLGRLVTKDPTVIRNPKVLKGAVDFGHRLLVTWLIDQGADPNSRGGGQADETCLHSAAWNGDLPMVELLLARGADPALLDRQYLGRPSAWARTAVDITNNQHCVVVAELLEREERSRGLEPSPER